MGLQTFEIEDTKGFLGTKLQVISNIEGYRLNFEGLLEDGIHLTSVTATVTTTGVTGTVSAPAESANKRDAVVLVTSTATTETFTVKVVVVTTDGQTLNFFFTVEVADPRA